jgi:hypothetical protein
MERNVPLMERTISIHPGFVNDFSSSLKPLSVVGTGFLNVAGVEPPPAGAGDSLEQCDLPELRDCRARYDSIIALFFRMRI